MIRVLACAAFLLIGARLQDPKLKPQESPLKPLEGMIGSWEGKGTIERAGEFTEEFTAEWTLNKKFIKATFKGEMGDKAKWEGLLMIGWDPDKKKMVSWMFAGDGGHSTGVYTEGKEKNTWVVNGKSVGGMMGSSEWRHTITTVDDDTTEFVMYTKLGEEYQKIMSGTYKRKK